MGSLPIVSDGTIICVTRHRNFSVYGRLWRGKKCSFSLPVPNCLMLFMHYIVSVILLVSGGKISCNFCVVIFVVIFAASMQISVSNVRDRCQVKKVLTSPLCHRRTATFALSSLKWLGNISDAITQQLNEQTKVSSCIVTIYTSPFPCLRLNLLV